MKYSPRLLATVLLLLCSGVAPVCGQVVDRHKVDHIKAAYLFHMVQLTTWPDDPLPAEAPLRIVCIGDTAAAVAELLAANTTNLLVKGRRLEVVSIRSVPATATGLGDMLRHLADARIAYLGDEVVAAMPEILAPLRGRPILVAGDGPDFCRHGGMVGFYVDDQRVRIRVDLDQARAVGLGFSAEFLQHVQFVDGKERQ